MTIRDEETEELSPDELLSRLTYPPDDLAHASQPLDQTVAEDLKVVRSSEVKHLLARWRGGLSIFPSYLRASQMEWQADLSAELVIGYASAASALMENALLSGFDSIAEALGTIVKPTTNPCFQIYCEASSTLAQESGVQRGTPVSYSVEHFAAQIALRCDVPHAYGELAWRALAYCMQEHQLDGLLPGVEIQAQRHELTVRLRDRYSTY